MKVGMFMLGEFWPIIGVVIGVAILLILIMVFKLNTFIALIITSMATGMILGMPIDKIVETIEKGMGDTLGHIAIIFGLGSILGDRKSTRLNSSHVSISYAVFCLKKKK